MTCTTAALLAAVYFLEPSLEPPPPPPPEPVYPGECAEGWTCTPELSFEIGPGSILVYDTTRVSWSYELDPCNPISIEGVGRFYEYPDTIACHESRLKDLREAKAAIEERQAKLAELRELIAACTATADLSGNPLGYCRQGQDSRRERHHSSSYLTTVPLEIAEELCATIKRGVER